jgi:hypothetical protein
MPLSHCRRALLLRSGEMLSKPSTGDVRVAAASAPHVTFNAHKAILSSRSPLLRDLLAAVPAGSTGPVIVPGTTPAMLSIALFYVYMDVLVLPELLPADAMPSRASSLSLALPDWTFLFNAANTGAITTVLPVVSATSCAAVLHCTPCLAVATLCALLIGVVASGVVLCTRA